MADECYRRLCADAALSGTVQPNTPDTPDVKLCVFCRERNRTPGLLCEQCNEWGQQLNDRHGGKPWQK